MKELTVLHQTARLLQNETRPTADLIGDVVDLLPSAWQYPESTVAEVRFRDFAVATPGFKETQWMQQASFTTRRGDVGVVRIAYTDEHPEESEGPFLKEERELIESLGEMLHAYFQHKVADEELEAAHNNLERLVEERTEDLRKLAAELSLAEARERRELAADLHDRIIQQFAFIKLRIQQFRGDAVFCGFEHSFEEIVRLLDGAIQQTRQLTFEISSPILYDLGLAAALERLAEVQARQHKMQIIFKDVSVSANLPESIRVTMFKCVQELLVNAIKYSQASEVRIDYHHRTEGLSITVSDNGVGFEMEKIFKPGNAGGFGLFSIRERMRYLGGTMEINAKTGKGASVRLAIPADQIRYTSNDDKDRNG